MDIFYQNFNFFTHFGLKSGQVASQNLYSYTTRSLVVRTEN